MKAGIHPNYYQATVIFYGQLIHNTIGVCAMQDFLRILKNFHCSSLVPFANGASEQ